MGTRHERYRVPATVGLSPGSMMLAMPFLF